MPKCMQTPTPTPATTMVRSGNNNQVININVIFLLLVKHKRERILTMITAIGAHSLTRPLFHIIMQRSRLAKQFWVKWVAVTANRTEPVKLCTFAMAMWMWGRQKNGREIEWSEYKFYRLLSQVWAQTPTLINICMHPSICRRTYDILTSNSVMLPVKWVNVTIRWKDEALFNLIHGVKFWRMLRLQLWYVHRCTIIRMYIRVCWSGIVDG